MSKVLKGSGYGDSEVRTEYKRRRKQVCSLTCVLGFYGVTLIVEWPVIFSHTVGTKCITV